MAVATTCAAALILEKNSVLDRGQIDRLTAPTRAGLRPVAGRQSIFDAKPINLEL